MFFFSSLRLPCFICLFFIRTLNIRKRSKTFENLLLPVRNQCRILLKNLKNIVDWKAQNYKYQLKIFLTFLKIFRLTNTIINKLPRVLPECSPIVYYCISGFNTNVGIKTWNLETRHREITIEFRCR